MPTEISFVTIILIGYCNRITWLDTDCTGSFEGNDIESAESDSLILLSTKCPL